MKWLISVALVISAAAFAARRGQGVASVQDDAPDQLPGTLESLAVTFNPMQYIPDDTPEAKAAQNVRAVLDMIAYAEGTSGPNGYRTMFGGGLVDSLADHPRRRFPFTNKAGQALFTTAAGRYQFLSRTWDELAAKLDLPDFGPQSQDAAAIELIRQRGALADVRAGRLTEALAKIAPIWASLPGAGYHQPERKLSQLIAAYQSAGGNLQG